MVETKYGKHFIKAPVEQGEFAPVVRFYSGKYFGEHNFTMVRNCISGPFFMDKDTHAHDFEQFLCFFGANPMDVEDFGAEVELSLGEEREKHIINEATIVHIPKGFRHCPLNFKKVDRPILFINISLTPSYSRLPKPE